MIVIFVGIVTQYKIAIVSVVASFYMGFFLTKYLVSIWIDWSRRFVESATQQAEIEPNDSSKGNDHEKDTN